MSELIAKVIMEDVFLDPLSIQNTCYVVAIVGYV